MTTAEQLDTTTGSTGSDYLAWIKGVTDVAKIFVGDTNKADKPVAPAAKDTDWKPFLYIGGGIVALLVVLGFVFRGGK